MYAIRCKATHKWLYGTDYRESPPKQRLSMDQALTYDTKRFAEYDMLSRECGDGFEIVKVKLIIDET